MRARLFFNCTNTQGWYVRVCICKTFPTLSSHRLPLLTNCQNKRLAVLFLHPTAGRHTHTYIHLLTLLCLLSSSFSFFHWPSKEWPRATSATHGNLLAQNQQLLSANTILPFSSIVAFSPPSCKHTYSSFICTWLCVSQYPCVDVCQTVALCYGRRSVFEDDDHSNHCWLAVFVSSDSCGPAGEICADYLILSLLFCSCWLYEYLLLCSGAWWLQ